MIGPSNSTKPGSQFQLMAIVAVTVLVMVLGVLVVVAPDQMGVPRPPATPAASPTLDVTQSPSP